MKINLFSRQSLLTVLFIAFSLSTFAQINRYADPGPAIQGKIIGSRDNLLVIQVWGTHYERGLAQGYLTGDKITSIFRNYIHIKYGKVYPLARKLVEEGKVFHYEEEYVVEAKAVIDGMNRAGLNALELDYIDLLVANSILDITSVLKGKNETHCSSLMSWGDATRGTDLNGKSVISRHLDWSISRALVKNQVMVAHIPSEQDEQPWAEVGFAGMISVLSGFNANMGVFQHMMDDEKVKANANTQYTPIWFALRKSIEKRDPNNDGRNNVMDVRSVLTEADNGFADGYIISSIARSTENNPQLIAMVTEMAPAPPYLIFRDNSYEDNIPGDNLYTANYQIVRNDARHYGKRYKGIAKYIGDGKDISLEHNRYLMAAYSHLSINYQFMTFAPEMNLFRISVYAGKPAYMMQYMDFNIRELFEK